MSLTKKILYKMYNLTLKIPRFKNIGPKPLELSDFSGYNQPYHPSVLYFKKGLFNYKYWMVQTPYPIGGLPYRDRWESPCIYWSNDGVSWQTSKENNPIDDLTKEEIGNKDYFSDPHLVYRDDTEELECWYRITHMNKHQQDRKKQYPTYLIRKTTKDGINWGKRELLMDFQSNNSLDQMIRSPSIIWDSDKGVYRMWYVDTLPTLTNRNIIYAESKDAKQWYKKTKIVLDKYIDPWHIDVNYFDNKYHLINYTLAGYKGINYYSSYDGISFHFIKELLRPSIFQINSFYRAGLYRSCSIKVEDIVRVYFSANDGIKTSIGVMEGNNFRNLRIIDASTS